MNDGVRALDRSATARSASIEEIPPSRPNSTRLRQRASGRYRPRGRRSRTERGDAANTVYLAVVDGDGNAVSMLGSGYKPFGSELVVGGFTLQNHGTSFSLDPDDANAIELRKRPSQLTTAMVADDGESRAPFGVMDGSTCHKVTCNS